MTVVTKQLSHEHVKRMGLNLAAELVSIASRYESDVSIHYEGGRVHMGSLIGVLAVATLPGEKFVLEVHGADEELAMKAVLHVLGA